MKYLDKWRRSAAAASTSCGGIWLAGGGAGIGADQTRRGLYSDHADDPAVHPGTRRLGQRDVAGDPAVDLKLTNFSSGPAIVQAIASGKFDVIYFGIGPAMVAQAGRAAATKCK